MDGCGYQSALDFYLTIGWQSTRLICLRNADVAKAKKT